MMRSFAPLAGCYGEGEYYARRRQAFLELLAPELAKSRNILDLGCGNGRYLAELARVARQARIIGADLLPEMLAEAKARMGAGTFLVQADAALAPFRSQSFDLIFASHVFPFVAKPDEAVRDVARCLAHGGVLAATVGLGLAAATARAVLGDACWARLEPVVFHRTKRLSEESVSEERHREAFRRAGLAVEARTARFAATWNVIWGFIEGRWLSLASEEDRMLAAEIRSSAQQPAESRIFQMEEGLLLGRKI